MKSKRSSKHSRGNGPIRSSLSKTLNRRATFEPLESRQLLAVTLPVIGTQLVQAGAPLNLALASTGTTNQVNYTVSINNTVAGTPNLSYTVPTTNTFLKLQVDDATDNIHGSLVFELFGDVAPHAVQTITNLVNQGYYNGLDFHRVLETFMIQGGGFLPDGTQRDPTATPYNVTPYANETSVNYKFSGSGVLALANTGAANSNTSQFFVTSGPTRFLDGGYTIFGLLVEGEDIRQALAKVPVHSNNNPDPNKVEISVPNNSIVITSASIVTDTADAVLQLSATSGSSGTSVVTVTATDSVTHETAKRIFTVYVQPDVGTSNAAPVLQNHSPALGNTAMVTPITIGVSSLINNGSGTTTVTDSNSGTPLGGIAITSLSGLGTWKYSLDGTNFVTITTSKISATSARLLSKNAKLIYTPDGTHAETPKISYLAWDMTFGNDGQLVPAQNNPNYGIAAFSTTSDTATLNVYVNTAPVLTPANPNKQIGPTLGNTTKNVPLVVNITSFINNGTGSTGIADSDPGASLGIAITSTTCLGKWEYSLDGGASYNQFSPINSAATSLLLPSTAKLRYTPDGNDSELVFITYKAWDMTTGTSGSIVDLSASSSHGQKTAFSDVEDSAMVNVNDAPVLTPAASSPIMGYTDKNTSIIFHSSSTFINNGNGSTKVTDPNTNAYVGGIAIVGFTGKGLWEYADAGPTYKPIGSASLSSALLLSYPNARLRYTPNGIDDEVATITYYAWDNTSSSNGQRVDLSQSSAFGLTSAFSSHSDTAKLIVNEAPVLTPAGSSGVSLGTTDENKAKDFNLTGSTGFINNGLGTTTIDDANAGIALTAVVGNGTWAYSIDGGTTYIAIDKTTILPTTALLLPKDAKLRYTPDSNNGETASISYRAWDKSIGTAGGRGDTSQNGGSTAFSAATDTATLTVTSVNDAPVLTAAHPALGSTGTSTAKVISLSDFINGAAGTTTSITDVDTGAVKGGIALSSATGNGTWAYSLDGGTTFKPIDKSTLANTSALLLPSTAKLRYTPDAQDSGLVTITYYAWDASSGTAEQQVNLALSGTTGDTTPFSTLTDTASLLVNDSPVLTPTAPSLGTTGEKTAKIFNLTDFINNGSGTQIADANAGGIALIAVVGNGNWAYSLDGGAHYTDIVKSTILPTSAPLLPKNAMLRYTPDQKNGETASITYCAWDQTSGTAGGRGDATQNGGSTAFSTATDIASLTVTSVNDAPVITTIANPKLGAITNAAPKTIHLADFIKQQGTGVTIVNDVDSNAIIGGIALVGVTGSGTWAYSIDGGTNFTSIDNAALTISAALLLDKNAILRYTPNSVANSETATITYRAWDTTTGTNGGSANLSQASFYGGATAFSADPDTASLVVNNAPVLTPHSPSLGTIAFSSPTTVALADFINKGAGTGTTTIDDPDGNAVKGGIALVGITGTGTWEYSIDGGTTFHAISSVSLTSSLLLPKDAKLRYTPNGSSGGTAKITYLAWDTTTGVAGGRFEASSSGGATAFSADSDTASLIVRAQPTDITLALSNGKLPDNTPIGSTAGAFSTVALPDGGTFTYSLVSGTGSDDNAAFTISGNNLVSAVAFNAGLKGTYNIRVRTTDQVGLTFEKALTITLTDVTAPTVTINQQTGQPDPTHAGQIIFKVVFSEPVADFIAADVVLSGTAPGASVQYVTGSGTTYEVKVTGMTNSGTVAATIPAGKAHDAAGNANLASTSDDNVVTYQKNWVVYGGTGKDDTFVFSPGATPGTWQVLVNATFYTIPAGTQGVILNGLDGNDSVKIVGTSANESFETWPDHGIFKSGDFEMDANNFESFALDGAGGNDSAIVHGRDSAPDTFVTGPGWVTMNGSTMPISNVENLTVVANPGQASTAYMFVAAGTAGKNSLAISPTSATLNMPGHVNIVQNFANVQVYTIPGGGDTATFADSSGDDLFVASPIGAQMFAKNGGSDISAWGFTHVNANSGGENDLAYFFTLPGSRDTFVMAPGSATYTGETFENKANGFKNVQAYADPAADSTATLIGTSGNDNIAMSPLGMQLYAAGGYDLSVWSFRNVVCQGNGGHDWGNFFGATSGSTTLAADSQSVTMTINGNSKTASGFERIYAYGNSSSDRATLDNAGLIETTDTKRPLDGSPYNHSLLLNGYDELWTTAKPSVTTPVQHAVDQVMSTYWP